MTKANEHLDRAINAADHKVKELYDQKQKRRHARALVVELLRRMEPPEWFTTDEDCGFNVALAEIKHRAGIVEGEG